MNMLWCFPVLVESQRKEMMLVMWLKRRRMVERDALCVCIITCFFQEWNDGRNVRIHTFQLSLTEKNKSNVWMRMTKSKKKTGNPNSHPSQLSWLFPLSWTDAFSFSFSFSSKKFSRNFSNRIPCLLLKPHKENKSSLGCIGSRKVWCPIRDSVNCFRCRVFLCLLRQSIVILEEYTSPPTLLFDSNGSYSFLVFCPSSFPFLRVSMPLHVEETGRCPRRPFLLFSLPRQPFFFWISL